MAETASGRATREVRSIAYCDSTWQPAVGKPPANLRWWTLRLRGVAILPTITRGPDKQMEYPMASVLPSPTHTRRLSQLRAQMKELKIDGYLITNRMDQFWLTGFTGEDGQVLITANSVLLLTDGRFDETAQTEAPWAKRTLRVKR